METKIYELDTAYQFVISENGFTIEYSFSKEIPEGQSKTDYLKSCKREAELLAQDELNKLAPPKEIEI